MKKIFILLAMVTMTMGTVTAAEVVVEEETGIGMLFRGVGKVVNGTIKCVAYPIKWAGEGLCELTPKTYVKRVIPDTVVVVPQPTVEVINNTPDVITLTPEAVPYFYQYRNYYNRYTPGYVPVYPRYYPGYRRPPFRHYPRPYHHIHHRGGYR